MRRCVAVFSIIALFGTPTFLQLVVRDGSVIDDGDNRDAAILWRIVFHFLAENKGVKTKTYCHFYDLAKLLIALVTYGERTSSNYLMHDVNTPNGAFGGELTADKWKDQVFPCGCRFGVFSFSCL